MSTKHISELIKSNIATILTEFPKDYIRPCNKSEFPVKPQSIPMNVWHQLNGEEETAPDGISKTITDDIWKSLSYTQKQAISANKADHRRATHNYAHICVSHIESTKVLKNGKTWNTYKERFFYVTSSTFYTDNKEVWVCFRRALLEDWRNTGFCDIIWFPKNTDKYAIATAGQVSKSFYAHCMSGDKKMAAFKVGPYDYIAFPLDVELKPKAILCPENTLFVVNDKNLATFDYIESVQYKHSTRCYKGIIYCVVKYPDGEFKETQFNSLCEAYKKLAAHFYGFEYSESTFRRKCIRGEAQLFDKNFFGDYECVLSYNKEDIEKFKENPQSFTTSTKEIENINGLRIEKTIVHTAERHDSMRDLVIEAIETEERKDSGKETDDIIATADSVITTQPYDDDLNKIMSSTEEMLAFLETKEQFARRAHLTYIQDYTLKDRPQEPRLF